MPGQCVDPLPLYFVPGSLDIFRGQPLPHHANPFVRLSAPRQTEHSWSKALADDRLTRIGSLLFRNVACLLIEEPPMALLQLGDFTLQLDSEIKALDGSRSA